MISTTTIGDKLNHSIANCKTAAPKLFRRFAQLTR
jgi:hypothetical protein